MSISERNRKRVFPWTFYLLPLLHLAVAIPLAYYLNIWTDEASTLYSTKDGLSLAFANAANEKQSPLYFVLLSGWRLIDDSVFFARLFSVIFSTLSIFSFFEAARRFWSERTSILATFFFAIHPYLFWSATEIRVYSLVILLTLILFNLYARIYLSEEKQPVWVYSVFVLFSIFALYTNFYLGFLLAGLFAALLVMGDYKSFLKFLLLMLPVGIAFLPLFFLTLTTFTTGLDGTVLESEPLDGVRRVWHHILSFALPTELFPPENQTWMSFVRVWILRLIILTGLGAFFYRRKLPERPVIIFGVVCAVIAALLVFAFHVLGMLYVEIRHAAVLFAPFMLFSTAVIRDLISKKEYRAWLFGPIAVMVMVFYSYGFVSTHPNFTKRGDWTRVGRFVEANEKPGDSIVVFRVYETLAFRESYSGSNEVYPKEKYFDWNYEGELGTAEVWPKQIEYLISVIPRENGRVWLLTEEYCQETKACEPLEKFVKENYTVVLTKDFYKERVRLLENR